jgi:hypothetical protein
MRCCHAAVSSRICWSHGVSFNISAKSHVPIGLKFSHVLI